jgi:predicted Fe-S protein YdhL (DUF1289 family)
VIELVVPEPASIASPCVNVCTIDDATGWCRGCGRTIPEIMNWSAKPPEERRAIRASLPPRMKVLGAR